MLQRRVEYDQLFEASPHPVWLLLIQCLLHVKVIRFLSAINVLSSYFQPVTERRVNAVFIRVYALDEARYSCSVKCFRTKNNSRMTLLISFLPFPFMLIAWLGTIETIGQELTATSCKSTKNCTCAFPFTRLANNLLDAATNTNGLN